MFIFVILLVIGAIYLLQQRDGRNFSEHYQCQKDHSMDALNILRERYARGEISEQEFNERKKILQA